MKGSMDGGRDKITSRPKRMYIMSMYYYGTLVDYSGLIGPYMCSE